MRTPVHYALELHRIITPLASTMVADEVLAKITQTEVNGFVSDVLIEQLHHFLRASLKLPHLGLYYGERLSLAMPNQAYQLLKEAPSITDGLSMLAQFVRLISPELRVNASQHQDRTTFQFAVTGDQQMTCETIAMVVLRLAKQYFQDGTDALYFQFPYTKPNHASHYYQLLGQRVRFNRPIMAIELMTRPNPRSSCQSQHQLQYDLATQLVEISQNEPIHKQVLAILSMAQFETPSRAQVAIQLELSERTLIRRLNQEQTSYRALVQREHYYRANQLLAHTSLTQSDIAAVLGYNNCANFQRAYKGWANVGPSVERNSKIVLKQT